MVITKKIVMTCMTIALFSITVICEENIEESIAKRTEEKVKKQNEIMLKGENKVRTLSLKEAETLALDYSYDIKSQLANKDAASGRIMSAIGEAMPSLSFTGGSTAIRKPDAYRKGGGAYKAGDERATIAGKETTAEKDGRNYIKKYNWTVSAEQPIYKGGKIISKYRGAKLYEKGVMEDVNKTKLQLIYDIRKAYYDLQYMKKTVDIDREQVELGKDFYNKTLIKYKAGDEVKLEVMRREVELTNDISSLIKSQNDYDTSKANFLIKLGLPLATELELTDKLTYEEVKLENEQKMVKEAMKLRPEMNKSILSEQMQEQSIKETRSGLFPSLSVVGSYSGDSEAFDFYDGAYKKDWSYGLKLDWTVFDRLLIRGQLKEARAVLKQRKYETMKLRDSIKLEIRVALLTLFNAMEAVLSQKENVSQAERVVQQQLISWEEGAGGSYLDVLESRRSLATAKKNYYRDLKEYNVAIADLKRAKGELLQEENEKYSLGEKSSKELFKDAAK